MPVALDCRLLCVAEYVASLTEGKLDEMSVASVVHILFDSHDREAMGNWDDVAAGVDQVTGLRVDAMGNPVLVRGAHHQPLVMLRPYGQRVPYHNSPRATIVGEDGEVFVYDSDVRRPVPLQLWRRADHGYGWGYQGTGPTSLYRALTYLVAGDAPAEPPSTVPGWETDPRSLYRHLVHELPHRALWSMPVTKAEQLVEMDRIFRRIRGVG